MSSFNPVIPRFRDFQEAFNEAAELKTVKALCLVDPKPSVIMGSVERAAKLIREATGVEPDIITPEEWKSVELGGFGSYVIVAEADSGTPASLEVCAAAKKMASKKINEAFEADIPKVFLQTESRPPRNSSLHSLSHAVLDDSAFRVENVRRQGAPLSQVMNEGLDTGSHMVNGIEVLTPDQAKARIEYLITYNEVRKGSRGNVKAANLLLIGGSGVGKTHIVEEVCRHMGLTMAVFNVPLMDQWVELIGIPIEKTRKIAQTTEDSSEKEKVENYLTFVREERVEKANIIFWDELSYGTQDKFNAILKIVNEGIISGTVLKNYVMSIGAMNPAGGGHEGAAATLGAALQRRWQFRIEIVADPNVNYLVSEIGCKREDAEIIVKWWNGLSEELKRYIAPAWLDMIADQWAHWEATYKKMLERNPDMTEREFKKLLEHMIATALGSNVFEGEPALMGQLAELVGQLKGEGVVNLKVLLKNPDLVGTKGYANQDVIAAIKAEVGTSANKLLEYGAIFARLPWEGIQQLFHNASLLVTMMDSRKKQKMEKDFIEKGLNGDEAARFWVEKVYQYFRESKFQEKSILPEPEEMKKYYDKYGTSFKRT